MRRSGLITRRNLIRAGIAAPFLLPKYAQAITRAERQILLGGGWVQRGAIIDEWFATQQAWPRPYAQEMVDTRSSSQYVTMASGLLVSKASDVLPISDITMLVEPTRTNVITKSQIFGDGTWAVASATVTDNSAAAPDGTTTAALCQSTGGETRLLRSGLMVASQPNSWSIFAKFGNTNGRYLWLRDFDTAKDSCFDLQTGTVVSSAAGFTNAISPSGNGFYRITAIETKGAIGSNIFAWVQSASSTNVSGGVSGGQCYVWGAQLEVGALPTSYIPTTTGSVTRAANAITIQRTGIGRMVFTFDDYSQQTVSGINTATQYTIPTNLNRTPIKRMTGYAL